MRKDSLPVPVGIVGAELFWDNDDHFAVRGPIGTDHTYSVDAGFADHTGASTLVAVSDGKRWQWRCPTCQEPSPAALSDCNRCEKQYDNEPY